MTEIAQLRELLAEALRQGKKFVMTEPGGYGTFDLPYNPSYRLEVNGRTIRLFDRCCGSNSEGWCYRQFVAVGDTNWRVSHLDGVSKKLLKKIPIATDEDIAKEFADILGDAPITLPQLRKLLAEALRQGKKFRQIAPGGVGIRNMWYAPTFELEVAGHKIRLFSRWCWGYFGSSYHEFVGVGDAEWRFSRLDGVSKKLLRCIPITTEADIPGTAAPQAEQSEAAAATAA
jgi:hypothetical protein